LCAFQLSFESVQARTGAETPPVQLCSQERDSVAVVVGVGLQLVDPVGRTHASTPGLENAVMRDYSPRLRASSFNAFLTAAGWVRASSSAIRVPCLEDSRCTES